MKTIEVVAAVIRKDDKIFATQRGYGEWKDWWEFPGGKMEPGETQEEALKREIREELSTDISVDEFLCTVEYDYPKFHLVMHCYMCSLLTDSLHLNEHEAAKWLGREELTSVKWLPADVEVIERLLPVCLYGRELRKFHSMLLGEEHDLRNSIMHVDWNKVENETISQSANHEVQSAKGGAELPPKCKNCTLEEVALLRESWDGSLIR